MKKLSALAIIATLICGSALAQGSLPGMSSPSIPIPSTTSGGGGTGCTVTGGTEGYIYNNGSSGCLTSSTLTTTGSIDTESGTLNITGQLQAGGNAIVLPGAASTLLYKTGAFVNGNIQQASGTAGLLADSGIAASNLPMLNGTNVFSGSIAIGAGSAITSSGPGGALGSNAFNSTAYLPLAGGTISGSLTIGAGSAITSSGAGGALGSNAFNSTAYLPLAGGTISGVVSFPTSDIRIVGSSTGYTALASANAGASNFTLTAPAVTDTLAVLGIAQTFTANQLFPAGAAGTPGVAVGVVGSGMYSVSTTGFGLAVNGTGRADYGVTTASVWTFGAALTLTSGNFSLPNVSSINWTGRGFISSSAANSIQIGSVDNTGPNAQTLQAQSVIAGNGNTAGGTFTIGGAKSNGSGSSDVVIATTASVASSGVQNANVTAITFKGGTQETIFAAPYRAKGYIVSTLPAGNQGDMAFVTDAVACTFLAALTGAGSTVCPVFYNGTAWVGG